MPYWQCYLVIGLVLAVPMVAILAKEIWVSLSERAKLPRDKQDESAASIKMRIGCWGVGGGRRA